MPHSKTMAPGADTLQPTASSDFAIGMLGPDVFAWLSEIFLTGVTVYAFTAYIRTPLYREDSIKLKLFVWVVFLLNAASAIIGWQELQHYLLTQKRGIRTIAGQTPADCLAQLPQALVSMICQIFFIARACRLFTKRWHRQAVLLPMLSLSVLSFLGAFLSVISSFRDSQLDGRQSTGLSVAMTSAIWLWLSAATDICTTGMLYFKLKGHILGNWASTDDVIAQIIRLSVATALPTTMLALLGASLSLAKSYALQSISLSFTAPLPSAYCLVTLYTLAARRRLRDLAHQSKAGFTTTQMLSAAATRPGASSAPTRNSTPMLLTNSMKRTSFGRAHRTFDPKSKSMQEVPTPPLPSSPKSASGFEWKKEKGDGALPISVAVQVEVEEDEVEMEELRISRSSKGSRGSVSKRWSPSVDARWREAGEVV